MLLSASQLWCKEKMINHVLVIYNPSAKSQVRSEDWIGDLVRELNKSGKYLVSFFPTDAKTQPHQLVPLIAPPLNLVVAAGGDGTVRFALAALARAKSDVPLAIFPMGTGNVLARNLGIVDPGLLADPLAHALDYIQNGVPMPLDMGMVNGEYFAGMTGVGPISDAFILPKRREKNKSKLFAYIKALLASIAMPARTFKITTAGGTFKVQASGIFISNVEDLGIGKKVDLDYLHDGMLDLHIIHPRKLKDYVELTKRYASGVCTRNSVDVVFRVKEVTVEVVPRQGIRSRFQEFVHKFLELFTGKEQFSPTRSDKLPCMIDGDPAGSTPLRVTVLPKAVNILVPAAEKKQIAPSAPQFAAFRFDGEPSLPEFKRAAGQ